MRSNENCLVKFVEIELVSHRSRKRAQLLRQRVLVGTEIQFVSADESNGHGEQTRERRQWSMSEWGEENVKRGAWSVERRVELAAINSFNAHEAADDAEHRQNAQRPNHNAGSFMRVTGSFGSAVSAEYYKHQSKHVKRRQHCDRQAKNE